jgi:sugar-specific transcriptional regulator TrmB
MMPKDLSRLLASGLDLREEYEKASKTLESIGLSTYEARGYIALVAHGFGSAETVAETAGIPRTSAYKVLQSLCGKGFAFAAQGRPMIFKPEAPANIKERVMKLLSETFDKLDAVHEVLRDKGDPQLVYTITEKERVLKKIGELMDSATESFIVSTPTFSEIREHLRKNIENAVKRGIKFTVITAPMQKALEGIDVHRKKDLIATDVIADGQTALIASPDLSACGFTDNAYLAKHLENFLQILMEHKG